MSAIEDKLKAPFPESDIEWRIQSSGISGNGKPWAVVLAYVTNRAIMNRLDEVFGIERWQNAFKDHDKAVECGIGVRFNDEWVWKWDAAEETAIDSVKGGRSASMKRAAVQWGIGRYLYNLDASFADCSLEDRKDWNRASIKGKDGKYTTFWWNPPALPSWALPQGKTLETANTEGSAAETVSAIRTLIEQQHVNEKEVLAWVSERFSREIKGLHLLTTDELNYVKRAIQRRTAKAA